MLRFIQFNHSTPRLLKIQELAKWTFYWKQKCQETIKFQCIFKKAPPNHVDMFVVHLIAQHFFLEHIRSFFVTKRKSVIPKPSQEPFHPIIPPQWEHHENPWRLRCDKKSSRVRTRKCLSFRTKKMPDCWWIRNLLRGASCLNKILVEGWWMTYRDDLATFWQKLSRIRLSSLLAIVMGAFIDISKIYAWLPACSHLALALLIWTIQYLRSLSWVAVFYFFLKKLCARVRSLSQERRKM